MRKFTTFLLVAAGALLAAASLHAETTLHAVTSAPGGDFPGRDVAQTVWFQGYIADQMTGDPIDGDYSVTVAIYDAALDGTLIWGPEAHDPVAVAAGWFIVELGSVTPLPSLDTPPYYVELAVDGETFEPRMKLASVPFALRADAAETTDDGDWTVAGPTIYPVSATNLAVGTTSPMAVLHVQTAAEAPLAFFGTPSGAGAASLHLAAGTDSTDGMVIAKVGPDSPMAVAGVPAASKGVIFTEEGSEGLMLMSESGPIDFIVGEPERARAEHALRIAESGHVGVGTDDPDTTLHVVGALKTNGLIMEMGATEGMVLTSDGGGNATWQAPTGTDGDWVVSGQNIYTGLTGNVGIGTSFPAAPLHIVDEGPYMSLYQTTGDSSTATMLVQAGSDIYDLLAVQKIGPTVAGEFVSGVPAAGLGAVTTGTSSSGMLIGSQGASPIHFITADGERMRVTAGGQIGIGTASPDTTLHVNGGIKTNAFQMAPGGTLGFVLASDGSGNGNWQRQHDIDLHYETETTVIGASYTQYDDSHVTLTAPGPGYAVVTSLVTVLVEHTQGTEDKFILGHTTDVGSGILQGDGLEWTVTQDVATHTYIELTFTVSTIHEIASAGSHTYYLAGRMSGGASANDVFWLATMHGVFYPDDRAGRFEREREQFRIEAARKSELLELQRRP